VLADPTQLAEMLVRLVERLLLGGDVGNACLGDIHQLIPFADSNVTREHEVSFATHADNQDACLRRMPWVRVPRALSLVPCVVARSRVRSFAAQAKREAGAGQRRDRDERQHAFEAEDAEQNAACRHADGAAEKSR
jgi:hypothetical protein